MADIVPGQAYDCILTLTLKGNSGIIPIRFLRGSSAFLTSGTFYYRMGTSGTWVSKTMTNPMYVSYTNNIMQIGFNWSKSGNNYTTCVIRNTDALIGFRISQKAPLSGVIGDNFMMYAAQNCENLESADVPDISGVTSVGNFFLYQYASNANLTSLEVPDTSKITKVGGSFMSGFMGELRRLVHAKVPDTSNITSTGTSFLVSYFRNCVSITNAVVPDIGGLTSTESSFMHSYFEGCQSLTSIPVPDTGNLTSVGNSFMTAYALRCPSATEVATPNLSNVTSVGAGLMGQYASRCTNLIKLKAPDLSKITSIGTGLFLAEYASDCANLRSLELPPLDALADPSTLSRNFMDMYAFGTTSLEELILPNSTNGYSQSDISLEVPAALEIVGKTEDIDSWAPLLSNGRTLNINRVTTLAAPSPLAGRFKLRLYHEGEWLESK